MPAARLPLLLACLAAVLLFAGTARAAEPIGPDAATDFISELSGQTLTILSDDQQPLEEREQRVRDLMDKHVAIDFIARFALGKHWLRASEQERADYTVLFRRFFLQKYAAMLGGYDNQLVTINGAKPAGDSDMLVETTIDEGKGAPPVKAGWRVRLFEQQPKIIDIVIEGISMALNQRQEFSSVLARGGLSGLMAQAPA